MKIVVLKFGGTSVGTIDRIKKVADLITNYVKKKYKVIVVASAMSGKTNDLVKKSKDISNNFSNIEYDALKTIFKNNFLLKKSAVAPFL